MTHCFHHYWLGVWGCSTVARKDSSPIYVHNMGSRHRLSEQISLRLVYMLRLQTSGIVLLLSPSALIWATEDGNAIAVSPLCYSMTDICALHPSAGLPSGSQQDRSCSRHCTSNQSHPIRPLAGPHPPSPLQVMQGARREPGLR